MKESERMSKSLIMNIFTCLSMCVWGCKSLTFKIKTFNPTRKKFFWFWFRCFLVKKFFFFLNFYENLLIIFHWKKFVITLVCVSQKKRKFNGQKTVQIVTKVCLFLNVMMMMNAAYVEKMTNFFLFFFFFAKLIIRKNYSFSKTY